LAKVFIMLVRVLGLAAIILGSLLWVTGHESYLGPHIGVGFCVAAVVFVMAVIAMIKRAVVVGVAGLLLAILLPLAGFMQLPLRYHATGAIQVVHVCVALSVIGVAERLYSSIRRAG
jgi:hypothetical protein